MADIKNLITSAFFTMKEETLGTKVKAQGKSEAVKNLHEKLKANKGDRNRRSSSTNAGDVSDGLSKLSSLISNS